MGGIACITGTSATSRGHTAASPNRNRLRGPFPGDRPLPRRHLPLVAAQVHQVHDGRHGQHHDGDEHAAHAPRFALIGGDLLLLLILFFLFREEADEEVLIAIGLLLIL